MSTINGILTVFLYCIVFFGSTKGKAVLERHPDRGGRVKRKAADENTLTWPNATIHFTVLDELISDRRAMGAIAESMKRWEDNTCIRFNFVRNNETESLANTKYAQFVAGNGCSSSVGRGEGVGPQNISIGSGCSFLPMIVHELGHLVGMWHEHARTDRDNHLVVLWDNIEPNMGYNFVRMPEMRLLAPYDFTSLMHYYSDTFSKNGQATLKALDERLTFLLDDRRELSFYDILTINKMYSCAADCPSDAPRCENEGFLQHTCTCLCPRGLTGPTCSSVISTPDCGGVFDVSELSGLQLTSPGFPQHYPQGLRCTWLLRSPSNTVMKMRLEEMDVERSDSRQCRDRLEIRYTHIGISRGPVFCGPEAGDEVQSASNFIIVRLVTNRGRALNKGFNATITVLPKIDCESHPCQNGGACRDYPDLSDYVCFCIDHWIGHNCHMAVVNGELSEWSAWSQCLTSCGVRSRHRTCTSPAPANGGNLCVGDPYQSDRCGTQVQCEDSYYCDFGNTEHPDRCGVRGDPNNKIEWLLHAGPTPTLNTGPYSGHTTGDVADLYSYLEASNGYNFDDATFWLPKQEWTVGNYCLQFYYSMRGESVATLAVLRGWSSDVDASTVWQRSGPQGDRWQEAHITVLLYRNVELGFFAVRGDGYSSDIAVDDISVSDGACQQTQPDQDGHTGSSTPYGCVNPDRDNVRVAIGDFFYNDGCIQVNCFCNQDSYLDCPNWMEENICNSPDQEQDPIEPDSDSNETPGRNDSTSSMVADDTAEGVTSTAVPGSDHQVGLSHSNPGLPATPVTNQQAATVLSVSRRPGNRSRRSASNARPLRRPLNLRRPSLLGGNQGNSVPTRTQTWERGQLLPQPDSS